MTCLWTTSRAQGSDGSAGNVYTTDAFVAGVGSAHRADTYLTPLHYDGWGASLNYEHFRAFRTRPLQWALNVGLDVDRTMNKVRNSSMLGAQFEARWSLFVSPGSANDRITYGVGGATTLDAGALYLSRNGNNPVAANMSWTIDFSGYASMRFKIGKVPVTALYRVTLPVGGVMFAPEYGQLYYEIYLGDRKGIFSGAFWGRYFRLDQRLTFDFKLGRRWLRAGYAFDVQSTKVHDITSRRVNHSFVVGVATDWLSVNKRTRKPEDER